MLRLVDILCFRTPIYFSHFLFLRYYIGIVDIFTEYGPRQKISRWLKTLLHCGSNHSSANPVEYARRLEQFLEDSLT